MIPQGRFNAPDEAATQSVAARLAQALPRGGVVLLSGVLGAGKTAFVRGMLAGLCGDPGEVSSPSFTLMNVYESGRIPLYHFDLYRLEGGGVLPDLDEYLFGDGICAVEWPEFMAEAFEGVDAVRVNIAFSGNGRVIEIGVSGAEHTGH